MTRHLLLLPTTTENLSPTALGLKPRSALGAITSFAIRMSSRGDSANGSASPVHWRSTRPS